MSDKQDKARLQRTAELLRDELRSRDEDGLIRLRDRIRCRWTSTDGWFAQLGHLGRGQPYLELWLDRWPRRERRYFYFGFFSHQQRVLRRFMLRAPDHLQPVRELKMGDFEKISRRRVWLLCEPLRRRDFDRAIYEYYHNYYFFFGMYDPTPPNRGLNARFVAKRAAAFFMEMIRAQKKTYKDDTEPAESGVYAQIENRRVARMHLVRERSGLLAEDRKIRDRYKCQVCKMRFDNVYGELGQGFAEAHHMTPLSRLKGKVTTTLDDLITVCSNCHRMLHKMDGKPGDVAALRRIVRRGKG